MFEVSEMRSNRDERIKIVSGVISIRGRSYRVCAYCHEWPDGLYRVGSPNDSGDGRYITLTISPEIGWKYTRVSIGVREKAIDIIDVFLQGCAAAERSARVA